MTDIRVCFFGDSITAGTGDETGQGWVGRLAEAENAGGERMTAYNLGIRRDTSRRIALRWRQDHSCRVASHRSAAICVMFGINDTGGAELDFDGFTGGERVPLGESLAVARDMLTAMRASAPVFWLGPTPLIDARMDDEPAGGDHPPRTERLARLDEAYAGLAAELGIPYLRCLEPLSADPLFIQSLDDGDGVHPTGAGHARLMALVRHWPAWRDLLGSA
jgi:lysophospholipase L1-like esterase